jgi:hypothetical protein
MEVLGDQNAWTVPDELQDLSEYLDHRHIFAGDDPDSVPAGKWGEYERHPIPQERDEPKKIAEVTAFAAMHHEKGEYWTDADYRHIGNSTRTLVKAVKDLRSVIAEFRCACNTRVRRNDRRAEKPFAVRVNRILYRVADRLRPSIGSELGRIERHCTKHNLVCKINNLSHVRQLYTLRGPSGDTITL